jgi:hypothetical protein
MSKALTDAKTYLAKMAAHKDCCGTVEMQALIEQYEKALLGIAHLSVMSPNYSDGKFEDYSSAFSRAKQFARECLAGLS